VEVPAFAALVTMSICIHSVVTPHRSLPRSRRAGMVRLRQHVEHHVHVTAEQIGNLREHRRDTEPY